MAVYHSIKKILADGGIGEGEAKAIALLLLEELCGMSCADVLMGREPADAEAVVTAARRVAGGEPVQYVTGRAEFCGLTFKVAPGVLIPRVETEELVAAVIGTVDASSQPSILDLCTGSGCVAIALATSLPGAQVTAVDISGDALAIARENAASHGASVRLVEKDILADDIEGMYDVIVSNPPYVCRSEAAGMERNVLDHEPHIALFVPDDAPLLFYRRIASIAARSLKPSGTLALEINRRFGSETAALLREQGFIGVQLLQDQFGNDRIVKAIKA